MALFEPAFDYLMSNEDPGLTGVITHDSGGETKFGISKKANPDVDVANLTLEGAADIYKYSYFNPIRGYDITSQRVASKLLDMAVNMGVDTAVKLCQRALYLKDDGVFGPETLTAVNRAPESSLLLALCSASAAHYQAIAAIKPEEAKYLRGWLKRAEKLPA